MENKNIVEYIRNTFPKEMELIERSLMNYYTLRNRENKTVEDEELEATIYDGVLKLFSAISTHLSEVFGEDKDDYNIQLKNIFIKT